MRIAIAGTTGGIGSATAVEARRRGWDVIEIGREDFKREKVFSDDGSVKIDALVFAAGTCPVAPLSKTDDALLDETFRVNCGLFLRLAREIVSGRKYSENGAAFVAVSSVSATEGWAGGAAYCASKGALSAMCRALSVELAPRKIRVIALEPRHVATRMFDRCAGRMGVPESEAQKPEDFAKEIMSAICATANERNGEPK